MLLVTTPTSLVTIRRRFGSRLAYVFGLYTAALGTVRQLRYWSLHAYFGHHTGRYGSLQYYVIGHSTAALLVITRLRFGSLQGCVIGQYTPTLWIITGLSLVSTRLVLGHTRLCYRSFHSGVCGHTL